MRILLITQDFPDDDQKAIVSGAVKNPFYLFQALVAKGHSVSVISFDRIHATAAPPLRHFELRRFKAPGLKLIFKTLMLNLFSFYYILRNAHRYDIIQSHHPHYAGQVAIMKSLGWIRTPLIIKAHGTAFPELRANAYGGLKGWVLHLNARLHLSLDRFVFKRAEKIVASSQFQLREMEALYRVSPTRLGMIRNGFPETLYRTGAIPFKKDLTLLFVGRLVPKKGVDYFIALVRSFQKFRMTKGLLVLGHRLHMEDFSCYKDNIKPLLEDSGFSIHFDVPEWELPSLYASANALIVPSRGYESIPTVIYEAHAAGIPVFATGAWGIPEVVHPAFHLTGDIAHDVTLISTQLSSNPMNGEKPLSQIEARENHCWKNIVIEFEKIYSELLKISC